jgi:hypothetical protein
MAGTAITIKLSHGISLIDSSTILKPEGQGKRLFTIYTSDDGLAMEAINYGHKSTICDSKEIFGLLPKEK